MRTWRQLLWVSAAAAPMACAESPSLDPSPYGSGGSGAVDGGSGAAGGKAGTTAAAGAGSGSGGEAGAASAGAAGDAGSSGAAGAGGSGGSGTICYTDDDCYDADPCTDYDFLDGYAGTATLRIRFVFGSQGAPHPHLARVVHRRRAAALGHAKSRLRRRAAVALAPRRGGGASPPPRPRPSRAPIARRSRPDRGALAWLDRCSWPPDRR
jgi:hypothetical protein